MTTKVPLEEGGLMPTYESACDLYRGDPDAVNKVGLGILSRSVFIAAGLYLAGMRGAGDLAKYSLAGSLGVEAFVLGWVWKESGRPSRIKML